MAYYISEGVPTSPYSICIVLNLPTGLFVMSSRHHQDGHATFIHDPESALAEKQEDSDFEHQTPGQTANISEEQRASDRVADKDKSSTLPVISLDWNGPDDPDNPHNWSIWKAAYHTTIPAVFGFAV